MISQLPHFAFLFKFPKPIIIYGWNLLNINDFNISHIFIVLNLWKFKNSEMNSDIVLCGPRRFYNCQFLSYRSWPNIKRGQNFYGWHQYQCSYDAEHHAMLLKNLLITNRNHVLRLLLLKKVFLLNILIKIWIFLSNFCWKF